MHTSFEKTAAAVLQAFKTKRATLAWNHTNVQQRSLLNNA